MLLGFVAPSVLKQRQGAGANRLEEKKRSFLSFIFTFLPICILVMRSETGPDNETNKLPSLIFYEGGTKTHIKCSLIQTGLSIGNLFKPYKSIVLMIRRSTPPRFMKKTYCSQFAYTRKMAPMNRQP